MLHSEPVTQEWMVKFVLGLVVGYAIGPLVAYALYCIVTEEIWDRWKRWEKRRALRSVE